MSTTPQAISAMLRRAGFAPVPRHSRDGLSIYRGLSGSVAVQVSIVDDPKRERVIIEDAARALREAGFHVELAADLARLTVTREAT